MLGTVADAEIVIVSRYLSRNGKTVALERPMTGRVAWLEATITDGRVATASCEALRPCR